MKKKPLYPGDEGYDDAFKLTPEAEERLRKEREAFYKSYEEHKKQEKKKRRSWFPFWAIFIVVMVISLVPLLKNEITFWQAIALSAFLGLCYQLISYMRGGGPTDRGDGFGDNSDGGFGG